MEIIIEEVFMPDSFGSALGQAIAGYRDKDTMRCAEGLVSAVEILREVESQRDAALAAVKLLQLRVEFLEGGLTDLTGRPPEERY